jgi:hypothetical protein
MFSRELLFLHKCSPKRLPVGRRAIAPTPGSRYIWGLFPSHCTVRYSGELSRAANSAFSPLYRHISSNNIGMTAPVETRYPVSTLEAGEMGAPNERGEAKVSFLYRNTHIYSGLDTPRSKDTRILHSTS